MTTFGTLYITSQLCLPSRPSASLVHRYIISKAAKLVARLPCFTLERHCSFGMGTNIQTNLPGTSSSSSCSLCRAPSRRKDVKAFRMTKTSFGLFGTFSRIMEFQTVEQKSEQRWLWKIGTTKLREAIQSRNPWGHSKPRVLSQRSTTCLPNLMNSNNRFDDVHKQNSLSGPL